MAYTIRDSKRASGGHRLDDEVLRLVMLLKLDGQVERDDLVTHKGAVLNLEAGPWVESLSDN